MQSYIKLVGATSYNVQNALAEDNKVLPLERINITCNSTAGAITIQLPKISNLGAFLNFELLIDDIAGQAGTNNITILTYSGDKINGNGTGMIMNTAYQKVMLRISRNDDGASAGNWMLLSTGCCDTYTQTSQGTPSFSGATYALTGLLATQEPYQVFLDGVLLTPPTDGGGGEYTLTNDSDNTTITLNSPVDPGSPVPIYVVYSKSNLVP